MLPDALKWNWKTFSCPSIAKISGGACFGSAGLCFSTKSEHKYHVTSLAAGVKKVRGAAADPSMIKPLKFYSKGLQWESVYEFSSSGSSDGNLHMRSGWLSWYFALYLFHIEEWEKIFCFKFLFERHMNMKSSLQVAYSVRDCSASASQALIYQDFLPCRPTG
nr:hypothetical protein [Tanacetum cinerariifolium]